MIKCPLCQEYVQAGTGKYPDRIEDDDNTSSFYCPTYVDVEPGRRWCHYDRKTVSAGYIRYEIVIPPFDFCWYPTLKLVKVEQFQFLDNGDCQERMVYHTHAQTLDDFVKLCNRFKNLKAFS